VAAYSGCMSNQQVDIHVDPACPWCWLTALWLFEVEQVRPITITTRLFSLAEVNRADDGSKHEGLLAAERALRVMVAARRAGGEPAMRRVYRELGEANHERGEALGAIETLRAAVEAAGLDAGVADEALADPSTLTELVAEHAAVVERGAFGVPTLSVDGSAPFFGPILDTRITGEAAGELWDIVAPVLTDPRMFELKRNRTRQPDVGRHRDKVAAASR
jgi:predicted DsbA family dithiol-disulfide isomerase